MKKIHMVSIIFLCTILCLPIFINTADAITGNSAGDSTPYVGVVVLFDSENEPMGYCSGFLLSPTVLVTAGHSLIKAAAVSVCFDEDPLNSNGYNIYTGDMELYPHYIPSLSGNSEFQTSDIGLIILDQPVEGISKFAKLPTVGLVDTLAAKTDLRVVGYGFQTQVTPMNNGPLNSWIGTVSRNTAQVELLPSNFQGSEHYLKFTANSAQGKGAIAFGDSGGPVIYTLNGQEVVVALNAFVSSSNCNGVSYGTRMDQPQVLYWIDGYLN